MSDQELFSQDEQPPASASQYEQAEANMGKENPANKDTDHDDPLDSLTWALILIWAGLVFLAANVGWLDRIPVQELGIEGLTISSLSAWSLIFTGAGAIVFLAALVRTFVPTYRTASGGNFFVAAALLGIGLGGIFGWNLVWPFILIAMGFSALGSALIQRRR